VLETFESVFHDHLIQLHWEFLTLAKISLLKGHAAQHGSTLPGGYLFSGQFSTSAEHYFIRNGSRKKAKTSKNEVSDLPLLRD
jgi:hypothetical protein